jgi:metal-responsive CopG/Arc/MetJ family transcriptional regulator
MKPKENKKTEIRVTVQPSMYKKLEEKCNENYRTISEIVRELLSKWLKEDK